MEIPFFDCVLPYPPFQLVFYEPLVSLFDNLRQLYIVQSLKQRKSTNNHLRISVFEFVVGPFRTDG